MSFFCLSEKSHDVISEWLINTSQSILPAQQTSLRFQRRHHPDDLLMIAPAIFRQLGYAHSIVVQRQMQYGNSLNRGRFFRKLLNASESNSYDESSDYDRSPYETGDRHRQRREKERSLCGLSGL